MFDIDVLLPDFLSILDAVPVTLAMALTILSSQRWWVACLR